MSRPHFTSTEIKILKMCLVDDDRLQQHHAYMFNCHYLPDLIQHLRKKLQKHFDVSWDTTMDNLYTERKTVIKVNGKKAKIGIFRLTHNWKKEVRQLLQDTTYDMEKMIA
ncbi:MAG: hypothetical protein P794_01515 [Epsilonproteobacteria bacterium (ex Lamellibrachia satsuma)]|nr:MAG: hypothetical protein P794_01515 [Epsilonproteobacteria bacterium (ex Lamellibrachia satsuma)]